MPDLRNVEYDIDLNKLRRSGIDELQIFIKCDIISRWALPAGRTDCHMIGSDTALG